MNIIILNGIYDLACGISLLHNFNLPISRIHTSMFNIPIVGQDKRFLAYWIITYGTMRVSGHLPTIIASYLIEAAFIANECSHKTIHYSKATFVVGACILLALQSNKLMNEV